MAVSEAERYDTFVTRTLSEVQEGLKLDNGQDGSCKKRVCNALEKRTTTRVGKSRNAAQKVIEGRFILGGDDASYLASGLAMLWSTVGTPVPSNGGQELSLAPAALYSPDAVNGIHRGLIAAMEKRNQEMRKDAPGALSNLMKALVPLVPFLDYEEVDAEFLIKGRLESVEERNKLFKFLVDAKQKLNADTAGSAHIPSSSLAFKIINQATKAHETAMRKKDEAAAKELKAVKDESLLTIVALTAQLEPLREKLEEAKNRAKDQEKDIADCEKAQVETEKMLIAQIAALTKELNAQTSKVQGLDEQLAEAKLAKSNADEEKLLAAATDAAAQEKLQTALEEANAKVDELQEETVALKAAAARNAAELAKLQKQLDDAKRKIKALQTALERNENEHAVKVQGLEAQILALEASEARAKAQAEKNVELQKELGKAQTERTACETAKTEVQEKLEQCIEDKQDATDAVTEADQKVNLHIQEQKKLMAQVVTLKEKLLAATTDAAAQAQLQTALEEANAKVEASKKALTEAQSALAACEKGKATLSEEFEKLRGELEACNKKLEVAAATCQANTAELKAQTQKLQAEVRALEVARNEQETINTKLVNRLVAQNKAQGDTLDQFKKQKAEEHETAVEEATKELEVIQGTLKMSQDRLLSTQARIDELKQELDNAKLNIGGGGPMPELYRAELKEQRADLSEEATLLQSTIARLETDIKTAEEDLLRLQGYDQFVPFPTPVEPAQASSGDAWIATAVFRGLVGQRGPTEPADVAQCPQDALLPYALPDVKQVVKHLLPAHLLLQSTPEPTAADLERAMGACAACEHADKRQRCATDVTSPATTSEALALFDDDFAITGEVPAAEMSAERHGVEMPHEVRWMPQGPRARTMARVAVMEHAVARCAHLAAKADVHPDVAAALRHAGAALKLQQLAPLYELYAAVENCDDPHPLGTGGRRLVTRPCAVVRGTLSFPVDAGVAPLTEAHMANANDKPLTQDASLAQAMGKTAMQTAALRNDLRKRGLAHNVYVAPAAHELAFRSAPTGVREGKQILSSKANPSGDRDAEEARKESESKRRLKNNANDPSSSSSVPVAMGEDAEQQANPTNTEIGTITPGGDPPKISQPQVPEAAEKTSNRASVDLYRDDTFVRIINRLIVAAAALKLTGAGNNDDPPDPVAAFLEASNPSKTGEGLVTPQTRREGLWAEMHRNVAISQDRLWIFVRLMSGKIGGNVSEVITLADEATLKAAKAIQEQRLEVSKRVSDMQAKIVETVVASMLKNSRMTMEYVEKGEDKNLAVIDAEARKDLKDLETGASGRPFFEANVALKNLTVPNGAPPKLKEVLSGLADVGVQMQSTLEQTLAEPGAASASLIELSHPSNSYFVSMRADAVAAIREAQEKLNCELGALGSSRRLTLWELVEGGCSVLVQRFAELCGYLLVQARTSTGVSAMYVSHQNIYTNASQARVSLARLTAAACAYTARVAVPEFYGDNPETARFATLTQGEQVRDIDITARRVPVPTASLYAPPSSNGWVNQGGRRYS